LDLKLGGRRTRYWVSDLAHLFNLDEIWRAQEYEPIGYGDYDLILDLGANIGAASIWLHDRHPEAQILAVEPDPVITPLLRLNTEPFDRITVVQAAVGVEDGSAELRSGQFSWHSSIVCDEAFEAVIGGDAARTSTVTVTTIPALISGLGLRAGAKVLAKIDVEGSEWALLRTPDALRNLSEIYAETHAIGAPAEPDVFLLRASRAAGFEQLSAPQGFVHWRRPDDRSVAV
jgi:FkbM family methyltransferase